MPFTGLCFSVRHGQRPGRPTNLSEKGCESMASCGEEKTTSEIPQVTFDEFDIPSYEKWKDAAIAGLKGADFNKSLFTRTYEDIQLEPIYTQAHTQALTHPRTLPGFDAYVRGTSAAGYMAHPWLIAQACDAALPAEFNRLARHELEKGATGVHAVLDEATLHGQDADKAAVEAVGKGGLSLTTIQDVNEAFDGIDFRQTPLHLYAGASSLMLLAMLAATAKAQGKKFDSISGCVGADPLGTWAAEGSLPCVLDALYDEMADATVWLEQHAPQVRNILVCGSVYHNGGANAIQELAYSLATAIAYIRALQLRGVSANVAAKHIRFSFSVGASFFMEIAKLRAARLLWAQIVAAFGGDKDAQKMDLQARTSAFFSSVIDPYVNMLRTTTQSFAAVVSGVDNLYVANFDEAIRQGDEFSRRIARNTQLLLQNECNLRQPIDPAGGSWYIETLTNSLSEKAWDLLQTVEAAGGIAKALQQDLPQQAVAAVLAARFKKMASRADRSVGINMYANMVEKPLEERPLDHAAVQAERNRQIDVYCRDLDSMFVAEKLHQISEAGREPGQLLPALLDAFHAGATIAEVTAAVRADEAPEQPIQLIAPHRFAEQFEVLRRKTEKYVTETGKSIKVFLANMGKIPQHKARADFSAGFMEVGGFEVLRNDGFPTVEEAAAAAVASGADLAIICSTDATYPELVPPLARAIKAAKPEMLVFLAGAPAKDYEASYREAGVDDFIHVRANCYAILTRLQTERGIV